MDDLFWAKVDATGDCWLWTGADNGHGYGAASLARRSWLAHRLAWTLLVGPIPQGQQLDHLCRTQRCVNPAHLQPVTPRTNIIRSTNHVADYMARTHCSAGNAYTPENTYLNPRRPTTRFCRTCMRTYRQRHRAARRRTST